ncbi:delta-aminolevulinic acid dehydratase [Nannochloropsis oceanica]
MSLLKAFFFWALLGCADAFVGPSVAPFRPAASWSSCAQHDSGRGLYLSAAVQRPTVPKAVCATSSGGAPATGPTSLGPLPPLEGFDPRGGNIPAVGTNSKGGVWVPQMARPRRNRKSEAVRGMVRENIVLPRNFIYPLFIHEETYDTEISSMPGQKRFSLAGMMAEVAESWQYGVKTFVLFPKVDDSLKTNDGREAYNKAGIVPRAIGMIKESFPEATVMTDVALDPYSDQGHDGIVLNGKIINDETIEQLCKQAICQARAGADIVAPSDMMDGRVGALRRALDSEGFTDVSIMAYTAKYASAYYGPFRDALDSHPGFGDKKTYQQDPANGREALLEAALDAAEGADFLMVKPGMPYLDVILRLKQASNLPIAAYHVSGEYAMLKAAAEKGWLNEKDVVLETMTCFKRAGCDIILTYYAKQAAKWLVEDGLI